MPWWVAAGCGLLLGLGLWVVCSLHHLRRLFPRRCQNGPQFWTCTRPLHHRGPCAMRLSYPGRFRYHLRNIRAWPGRQLRRAARRWAQSQIRCPSCGMREAPDVIEPCRHCGYFSPF